jgi:hypothetical protein
VADVPILAKVPGVQKPSPEILSEYAKGFWQIGHAASRNGRFLQGFAREAIVKNLLRTYLVHIGFLIAAEDLPLGSQCRSRRCA